jgi:hypothetical protein
MNTGPGTPEVAMRKPVRMYSASRLGSLAVNDALVMGASSDVCSISWSAPLPLKRSSEAPPRTSRGIDAW